MTSTGEICRFNGKGEEQRSLYVVGTWLVLGVGISYFKKLGFLVLCKKKQSVVGHGCSDIRIGGFQLLDLDILLDELVYLFFIFRIHLASRLCSPRLNSIS